LAAIPLIAVAAALLAPGDDAWAHLANTNLLTYVSNTGLLMLLTGAIAAVIGVSSAWLIAATDFKGRALLSWALVLPLAAPAYIIAYLYTDLLAFSSPVQTSLRGALGLAKSSAVLPNIRSLPGAAFLLALVLYPYIYLLARTAFQTQASSQFQAARTLGQNAYGAFFKVALPSARPAIAGGLALVLMETLADFGVADYFALPTFSTGIFRTWLALGEKQAALKLAGVMLLVVALLVMLEAASRKGRTDTGGRTAPQADRMALSPRATLLAWGICGVPVLLGFVIPMAVLSGFALSGGDQMLGRGFALYAWNSARVAIAASLIAVGIALLLSYVQRASANRLTNSAIRFSTLGYALPGALLAVGLLGPIGAIDRSLTDFAAETFAWRGGLLLTGTTAVLLYAYVVRFLTVSFNTLSASLGRIPLVTDAAARTLGAGPWGVLRRIHLPMIRSGLLAAGLLVFVDVMRELPATLILRPFNFETLATRVYRLAGDERLTEASTAALSIVLIGLVPILLLNRASDQTQR
jgi:iron(III) transport system permease protein